MSIKYIIARTLIFMVLLVGLTGFGTMAALAEEAPEQSTGNLEGLEEQVGAITYAAAVLQERFAIWKAGGSLVDAALGRPQVLGVSADGFYYHEEPTYNWKKQVADAGGLKVMWWNVECLAGESNTNKNLRNLIKNKDIRPDVLVIGEYCHNAMQQSTLDALESNGYVYSEWIKQYTPYHVGKSGVVGDENGMRVFSQLPLKGYSVEKTTKLSGFMGKKYVQNCIAGKYAGKKEANKDYWNRRYMEFKVNKGGERYTVVPIHFANPWPFIYDCKSGTSLIRAGKTGWELVYGKSNPTYGQAEEIGLKYGKALEEGFLATDVKSNTLVIGDTNAPKKVKYGSLSVSSKPYQAMIALLGQSEIKNNKTTIFSPYVSTDFGNISIDHAFAANNLNVKFANVVPFAGSDHAAIYVIIK